MSLLELSKEFAPNIGLTVRGIYAEDDSFEDGILLSIFYWHR